MEQIIDQVWQANGRKGIGRLTKGKFYEILGTIWSTSMKHENIVSEFVSTGLFSHDKTKFSESEFDPINLENYYKNKAE